MNEFLKLEWKTDDIAKLEPQKCFITEEALENSIIYKYLERKNYLYSKTKNVKPLLRGNNAYVPGDSLYFPTVVKSTLDKWHHKHCLTALKLLQSGKDPSTFSVTQQFSVEKYNIQKHAIHLENAKYQTFARIRWETDKLKLLKITHRIFSFAQIKWEKKCRGSLCYPQYYKELSQFNISPEENDCTIDFHCVQNLLEVGTVAKFSHPNLKTKCTLACSTLPKLEDKVNMNSRLPVSKDENIKSLLESHSDIQIVIPLSSLKCIADNSDLKTTWNIPFCIKEIHLRKEDGTVLKQQIAFIDKPFPQTSVTRLDFAQHSFKTLIKTNFCQFEAFSYEGKDIPYTDNEIDVNSTENCDDAECGQTKKSIFPKKSEGKIHHNATYRLWSIKKMDCQRNLMKNRVKPIELKVLVRGKLDGCEVTDDGVLQPVILTPQIERQVQYGANIPSKRQLSREWSSLFFRPFSILHRVRIAPTQNEVISVEKCTIQKVVSEAQIHYDFKPNLGLCRIQKVLEEITKLGPGSYLLQHLPKHEAFVSILKECDTNENNSFDLHDEYTNNLNVSNFPKEWLPMDVNFILPAFEANQRMPAMFTPKFSHFKKNQNGAKEAAKTTFLGKVVVGEITEKPIGQACQDWLKLAKQRYQKSVTTK